MRSLDPKSGLAIRSLISEDLRGRGRRRSSKPVRTWIGSDLSVPSTRAVTMSASFAPKCSSLPARKVSGVSERIRATHRGTLDPAHHEHSSEDNTTAATVFGSGAAVRSVASLTASAMDGSTGVMRTTLAGKLFLIAASTARYRAPNAQSAANRRQPTVRPIHRRYRDLRDAPLTGPLATHGQSFCASSAHDLSCPPGMSA